MPEQEPRVDDQAAETHQGEYEPVIIPMEDPATANRSVIRAETPAAQAGGEKQGTDAQGTVKQTPEEYWKQEAINNRAAAERFSEYSTLISHLEQNPDHINYLQRAIDDDAAGILATDRMAANAAGAPQEISEGDALAVELGVDSPANAQAPRQQVVRHEMTNEEAMRLGEEKARARMEFQNFHKEIASKGIPDHLTDQFVQHIQKPNAFTLMDLFVAWRNKHGIEIPEPGASPTPTPKGQPVVGAPISVTSMPAGDTNRPDQQIYQQEGDGSRFVQDPSNI